MTRRPPIPCTLRRRSTTAAVGSGPMRQVDDRMIDRAAAPAEVVDPARRRSGRPDRAAFPRRSPPPWPACEASLRRNFTPASISATSASVEKALGTMRGGTNGSAERIPISPRLVGRQFDRPIEKPGHGSGVRIGRSPALGIDGREGLEIELHVGARVATRRCGRSRRHCSSTSESGPRRRSRYWAPTNSLPHQGRRSWLSVRCLALKV